MGNLLYVVAVILIIAWAVGFFAFSAGGIIHVLLVIAIIADIVQNYFGQENTGLNFRLFRNNKTLQIK
jgi:hypothetical protein